MFQWALQQCQELIWVKYLVPIKKGDIVEEDHIEEDIIATVMETIQEDDMDMEEMEDMEEVEEMEDMEDMDMVLKDKPCIQIIIKNLYILNHYFVLHTCF